MRTQDIPQCCVRGARLAPPPQPDRRGSPISPANTRPAGAAFGYLTAALKAADAIAKKDYKYTSFKSVMKPIDKASIWEQAVAKVAAAALVEPV